MKNTMRRWQEVLDRINEEIQEMERGLEGRPRFPPLPMPPVDGRDGPDGRNGPGGRESEALARERAEADEERAAEMRLRERQRRERARQRQTSPAAQWDLRAALSSPDMLRQAILLREILGPPKALRENDEGRWF